MNVSWSTFFLVTGIGLVIYYAAVYVVFFRKKGSNTGGSSKSHPSSNQQYNSKSSRKSATDVVPTVAASAAYIDTKVIKEEEYITQQYMPLEQEYLPDELPMDEVPAADYYPVNQLEQSTEATNVPFVSDEYKTIEPLAQAEQQQSVYTEPVQTTEPVAEQKTAEPQSAEWAAAIQQPLIVEPPVNVPVENGDISGPILQQEPEAMPDAVPDKQVRQMGSLMHLVAKKVS